MGLSEYGSSGTEKTMLGGIDWQEKKCGPATVTHLNPGSLGVSSPVSNTKSGISLDPRKLGK